MKSLSWFATLVVSVIAAWASSGTLQSQPAAAATMKGAPLQFFTNLTAAVKGGQIVVSWSLDSYNHKMQVHVTRTPAFDASFQPAGYALLLPPQFSESEAPGHTDEWFTDSDAKENVTYNYTVCAFWIEAVYGNGSSQPPTAQVNQTACAGPVTARLGLTPIHLGLTPIRPPLQILQPTIFGARRNIGLDVVVGWLTTGPGKDTAHLYLMVATAASAPAATFTTPGWRKYAAVSPTVPQPYHLTVTPAPNGKFNYYMVCAANSDDTTTLCSKAIPETVNIQ
jgi:hypothetical protein